MKKQIFPKRFSTKQALIAGLALLVLVTIMATVRVMATQNEVTVDVSDETDRPMLMTPPTASVTTSITNGVYMQDPQTKIFRKVSQESTAQKTELTANSTLVRNRMNAVTPNGPRTLNGFSLYVDPALRLQGRNERIASQPVGRWFGGWNSDVRSDVSRVVTAAAQAGTVPTLVAYNIPVRDCGSYSAGGANSSAAYREWIQNFADGIELNKAIVVLEPDALPGLDCLSASGQRQRLADLSFAVQTLAATGAATYLDAGNYTWQSVSVMT